MPTYDYHCDVCGPMEVFQSMRDDPLKRCPECGGRRFQRQISGGAGVIFKGEGFYETDYNRSKDYRDSAKAESGCGSGCGCHPAAEGGAKSTPAKTETAAKTAKPAAD